MEEPTDVKIPIEKWMQSQDISGFPKIIGKILDQLDLDSLIDCRQVSMTFKNFLDNFLEKKRNMDRIFGLKAFVKSSRTTVWPCQTKPSAVLLGPCFFVKSKKEGPSTIS